MEEIIKKLLLAIQDGDTAEGLKKFGIEADQVEGIKDLKVPATLDEALAIKEIQSEYDKRLGKAATTREENLKAKFNFVEKEQEDPKKEEVKSDDPTIQALLDKLSAMEEWKKEQEAEKQKLTTEQKRANFAKNLKEKGIPAVYVHELDLDKDFDEQFDTVSKKFEEDGGSFKAETPKPGQGRLPNPRNPGTKNEPSKEEIEAFKRNF